MRQGDLPRAESFLLSSLRRYEQGGLERRLSHTLLSLGELRQRQDRIEESADYVRRAIDLARRLDETQALAAGHRQLGELHAARGEREEAAADFERALGILHAAGLERARADCVTVRDRVLGHRRASEASGSSA
jgi:tetratricopeptide (TPR) repeat protein